MTNVVPIQAPPAQEGSSTCPNCGAAVVGDQRYCLACGQPCSPVRLAFLDVLQSEARATTPVSVVQAPPVGYLPPLEPDGALGWLRRYSGLLALLSVLLTTGLIGLLIGHWLAPSKTVGPQVVKIEGLPAAGAAAAGTSSAATSSKATTPSAGSAATEAQEKKEVKEAEAPQAKAAPPVKASAGKLSELSKLTGKKHQQAIEKLTEGDKPIETGG